MKKITNREVGNYVSQRKMFRTNSGAIFPQVLMNEKGEGVYVVYSYGLHFPMYVYKQGVWYGNSDKYSTTTSHHIGKAHPGHVNHWLPTNQLQAIIKGEAK